MASVAQFLQALSMRFFTPCNPSGPEIQPMKPATIDMLRAHLMVASFTAMAAELLACLVLFVLPVSQHAFSTTPFRLIALAIIACGVVIVRQLAHAAFDLTIRSRHAQQSVRGAAPSQPVAVQADCPRRWLVILHLRSRAHRSCWPGTDGRAPW
ncbi:MAG: FIG00457330: hypothetical protein [uncultured Paraburkholderia sp.]|nr:MAG: FIG00457330: hypothetical protein [uncultured Paraburkholderia sp.]CAH2927708.1 MAG: FIG00457330: hypothetical protein [uncultured Paraburkholderia sp.]